MEYIRYDQAHLGKVAYTCENKSTNAEMGFTPLHIAIIEGDVLEVQRLMKFRTIRAAINKKTHPFFITPLHLAVSINPANLHIIRILLEQGADVNAEDMHGSTPLHMATLNSVEVVYSLIRYGADVNATNKLMMRPLHIAAALGSSQTLEALVSNGAKINSRDINRNTAMLHAIENDKLENIITLFNLGSAVRAIDLETMHIMYGSKKYESKEVYEIIQAMEVLYNRGILMSRIFALFIVLTIIALIAFL